MCEVRIHFIAPIDLHTLGRKNIKSLRMRMLSFDILRNLKAYLSQELQPKNASSNLNVYVTTSIIPTGHTTVL